jgi:hypothetical protein
MDNEGELEFVLFDDPANRVMSFSRMIPAGVVRKNNQNEADCRPPPPVFVSLIVWFAPTSSPAMEKSVPFGISQTELPLKWVVTPSTSFNGSASRLSQSSQMLTTV